MKSAVTQAPDVGGAGRLLRPIWEAWMEIGKNYQGEGRWPWRHPPSLFCGIGQVLLPPLEGREVNVLPGDCL